MLPGVVEANGKVLRRLRDGEELRGADREEYPMDATRSASRNSFESASNANKELIIIE